MRRHNTIVVRLAKTIMTDTKLITLLSECIDADISVTLEQIAFIALFWQLQNSHAPKQNVFYLSAA